MSRKFKNSTMTKVISGLTGLMTAVVMVGGAFVVPASAATAAELQAQIDALLAQVKALQSSGSSSSMAGGYTFTRNLKQGSTGADVKALQELLNSDDDTMVSASGAGSAGKETTYFGPATKRAVIKFQEKYADEILAPVGLTRGTGLVGPSTRAYLNEWSASSDDAGSGAGTGAGAGTSAGSGTGTTPPPAAAASLTVSAATQPANSLAPQSASRVPFTTVTLTAGASDVLVKGITVQRGGLAQDAVFSGIVLLNADGTQIGIAKTLNSDHTVTVGDPWTLKAGTSQTLTIAGNMGSSLSTYAGQVAQLSIVGVQTDATVSGTFPISGAQHTINATLTTGTTQLAASSFDPQAAQSKEIGTTNFKFAGVRVTAGSAEKVWLKSLRWYQSGSAASGDLANLVSHVDGDATLYSTTVSADGKYYTTMFGSTGILIDKGLSKDIYLTADIVGSGSSGRTVQFDIYKTTDVYLVGETYGYGITPTANANCATSATTASEFVYSAASCAGTASTPWYSGSTITVSAGSITTIQKASSVPAQNVAINVPNQVLGGYTADVKGEAISVQNHEFSIASTTGSGTGLLTSVTLVDENGAIVAGPVDATYSSALVQLVSFTDTVTYKLGAHTYTLKGKIASTIGTGGTYIVSINTPATKFTNSTGQTTGNTITWPSTTVTMNTMTVKGGSLVGSVSSQPTSQSIVAGGTPRLLANYQLDASQSGEDVRFSALTATMTGVSFSTTTLSNCQLYNDAGTSLTTGSNTKTPASTDTTVAFTLDSTYTVPKGTIKTLSVKCNIASGGTANSTIAFGLSSVGTVTGQVSGNTITPTYGTLTGPTMTIATGSFAGSLDSSAPSYTLVGSSASSLATGVTANQIKLRATNEAVNLTKLGLTLTNTASSSASDLVKVTLWDGATFVGDATFTGTSASATSTLTLVNPVGLMLPKDQDKVLTVKADFAGVGTNLAATQGHLVAIDLLNSEGTGAESGSTIYGTGSTAVAGLRLFKAYPTIVLDSLPTTVLSGGDTKLMRFKITASPSGDIGIYQFGFTIATTSATVSAVNFKVFTDAAYSNPVSGFSNGQFDNNDLSMAAWASSATEQVLLADNSTSGTLQVPAGQTRYFEMYGTVAGVTTGSTVKATLMGDALYPAIAACITSNLTPCMLGAAATAASNSSSFVWSPNATTTSSISANDWTNGYGVTGLPSGGVSQTVSK